tara:strand:- start:1436 stop:1630 length:195 start_codon:yes stop_codon:yes gene_type:complete
MEQIIDLNIYKREVKTEGNDVIAYYYNEAGDVVAREFIDTVSGLHEEFSSYAEDEFMDKQERYR